MLKDGDVLKIDCGVVYQKGITDAAVSLVIGGEFANPLGYSLIQTTKKALDEAILYLVPGNTLYPYSQHVHQVVTQAGFSVLKKLTGHGVGKKVHEEPHIYNFPHPRMKEIFLSPGMVLACEPITAISSTDFYQQPGNEWNVYCKDHDIGAQWEYTVLITEQ